MPQYFRPKLLTLQNANMTGISEDVFQELSASEDVFQDYLFWQGQ